MIEARHLRVLRAVSRAGSFSAAARELGCTQPAVSQQMKALELSAGTPLVVRVGRGMRLTEAGEALTRHATGILAGLTAAEEEIAAIVGLRAGRVRLVSFPSGSSTIVPNAVAWMRADHPGTNVSLEEAEPPRSVEMLRSGDCEVVLAFRYLRPDADSEDGAGGGSGGGSSRSGGRSDSRSGSGAGGSGGGSDGSGGGEWDDLVVRPLLTDRLVGLVPSGHRLARAARHGDGSGEADGGGTAGSAGPHAATAGSAGPHAATAPAGVTAPEAATAPLGPGDRRPVRMAELADERWIAGCPRCRRHLVDVCESEGFTPRIDFATDDYPAVTGLVGAGLGVAMLPELALRSVRPEGVALIDVYPAIRREVVALTLPDLAHVPAVDGMLTRLVAAARG